MSDDKPVVLATTKTFRTLADGGVSITFDIAANDAADAFRLFGMNGSKVGIAPITAEAARSETRRQFAGDNKSFTDKSPSQQAFILCKRLDFWRFIENRMGYETPSNEDDAAEALYNWFDISSRSELDAEPFAEKWRKFEAEFYAWRHGRR